MRAQLGLELVSGTPSFTNFTPDFTDTLDYVFIEGGAELSRRRGESSDSAGPGESKAVLSVEGRGAGRGGEEGKAAAVAAAAAVAPMPEEGELRAMTPGLPSETYPSDHVSLVVDLALWT